MTTDKLAVPVNIVKLHTDSVLVKSESYVLFHSLQDTICMSVFKTVT